MNCGSGSAQPIFHTVIFKNPRSCVVQLLHIRIVTAAAGRECLDQALDLLRLLRLDQSNIELLLQLAQTEKGKNKEMALESLGCMVISGCDDIIIHIFADDFELFLMCKQLLITCNHFMVVIYEKMAKKGLSTVCRCLLTSTTKSASQAAPDNMQSLHRRSCRSAPPRIDKTHISHHK